MLNIPGLEEEAQQTPKAWRHISSFVDVGKADTLCEKLQTMQFTPHPTDGPGPFYKTLGQSYTGRGTQFEPLASVPIPEGWRKLADRVSKESQSPVNYIQIHKFAPAL